jgi:hypothetical protein
MSVPDLLFMCHNATTVLADAAPVGASAIMPTTASPMRGAATALRANLNM